MLELQPLLFCYMCYNKHGFHSQTFFKNYKLKHVDYQLKYREKPVDSYLKILGEVHEQDQE